jgi:hypothetical protein
MGQAVEPPHPVITSNDSKGDGGVGAHRLSRHCPPMAEDANAVFLFTRCRVDPDDIILHDPAISFVTAGFAFPVLPRRDEVVKRAEVFVPSGIHLRICILIVVNSGVPVLCENNARYRCTHVERSEHKADYNDAYEHREEAQATLRWVVIQKPHSVRTKRVNGSVSKSVNRSRPNNSNQSRCAA